MKKTVIFLVLLVLTIPFSSAAQVPIEKLFQVEEPITETLSEEIATSTTYIYAGSKLLATKNNEEIKYHYQDRLGSDINSKTLPFGQEIYSEERFSFTGKELDQDLYYFNARYYNPQIGRFTSTDPVPTEPVYQYVANNPMNLIDPTGTEVGDPMGYGLVENLYGAPVSQEIHEKWQETRGYYDKIQENPGWLDKTLLFLHSDYDNFEDWHGYMLRTGYPDMYYNPNPENQMNLREIWDSANGLEKTLLVANVGIYLVTVFGGPFAAAAQSRQSAPIRPTTGVQTLPLNRDASSPARSMAAKNGLLISYRAGTSIFQQQGYWRSMSEKFQIPSQFRTVKLSPHAAEQAMTRQIKMGDIRETLFTAKPVFQRTGIHAGSYLFTGEKVSIAVNSFDNILRSHFIRTAIRNK